MIFRLEIENFYCFRDRQVVDLEVAENVPDVPGRFGSIAPGVKRRTPKIVALFGANASGKSTVLRALTFVAWFARDSFEWKPEARLPIR
jgi:AAA15 family ATPase/GTPase